MEDELIDVVDAGLAADAIEHLAQVGGEKLAQRASDGGGAGDAGEGFHARVPAFDAVVEIGGEDADVDGFDDVFAEFLEALVLLGLALERFVEADVFEGDADVAGESGEEIDVVAGEEIALFGAA